MNKNKKENQIFLTLQTIGRAFFLPVSILPVAGLLLGLGASFTNPKTIAFYHLDVLLDICDGSGIGNGEKGKRGCSALFWTFVYNNAYNY